MSNLLNSACIDHNSFVCCFSRCFERCDVIVMHYFMKVKCFSFCTLPKLASYSDSICCMLWFCSGGVKSCFHKKWWWRTILKWYRVKFRWWKVRIGKAIIMYSKFHINPPDIVYVINCILTHTFFFPWVYFMLRCRKSRVLFTCKFPMVMQFVPILQMLCGSNYNFIVFFLNYD